MFWVYFIARSNLKFKAFICYQLSFICFKFTNRVWNVGFIVSLLWLTSLCSRSVSSFLLSFWHRVSITLSNYELVVVCIYCHSNIPFICTFKMYFLLV